MWNEGIKEGKTLGKTQFYYLVCKFCPLRRVYYKIDVQSCLTLFVFTMSRCRLTFYPGKGEVIWDVNIKFGYSEKATKFCEIFTLLLSTVHTV